MITDYMKCLLTDGENEGGLAAVALTIGEENVKGTQGGVEAVGSSWGKKKKRILAKSINKAVKY